MVGNTQHTIALRTEKLLSPSKLPELLPKPASSPAPQLKHASIMQKMEFYLKPIFKTKKFDLL